MVRSTVADARVRGCALGGGQLALEGSETGRAQRGFVLFYAIAGREKSALVHWAAASQAERRRPQPACLHRSRQLDSSTGRQGDLDHQAGHAKAGESQRQVPRFPVSRAATVQPRVHSKGLFRTLSTAQ